MAPHWDKVMAEINVPGSSTLVADVDCTAAGKPICDSNGVKGFPTVKLATPPRWKIIKEAENWTI